MNPEIEALVPALTQTRRMLHADPEPSGNEARIAAFVADSLRRLGLPVRTGVGGHGVVADLDTGRPGRTLALRADMDALPITEANRLPYVSRNPGLMHACGHDGHTTILLGAAQALAARRSELAGRVRFLFQPAEETVEGARALCAEGAMDGVDAIVGLHGWPGALEVGQIAVWPGPVLASADTFEITVRGSGAHAAMPNLGVDPIVTGAQIVLALQTIVSREVDPIEPAVVTVGIFQAGAADNVIPPTARIAGTVRTLTPELRDAMPEAIRRIVHGVCAASRATADVKYRLGTPPTVNDPAMAELVAEAAAGALGPEQVVRAGRPRMGAEDFAVYLERAPGAFFMLGLGGVSPIHTPTFDFDDRALPIGVAVLVAVAERYLARPTV